MRAAFPWFLASVTLLTACHDVLAPAGFPSGEPDPVPGDWVAVGAGEHTSCALDRGGRAYCWGVNDGGLLGTGAIVSSITFPTPVRGPSPFTQISVGSRHQCALAADGTAYCWGDNNYGQLGTGDQTGNATMPTAVSGGIRFRSITAGYNFTCAIASDDRAYCWGDRSAGQLGTGPIEPCDASNGYCRTRIPTLVGGGLKFSQLSAGFMHACGIVDDGTAYCWGDNRQGEIGNETISTRCGSLPNRSTCIAFEPTMVHSAMKFTRISAGSMYSCAIALGGSAFCWGAVSRDRGVGASHLGNSSYSGYYGANQGSRLPVPVEGGLRFSDISAGLASTCGLTVDGKAFCWGSNNFGQLGIATMSMNFTTTPRAVRMPAALNAPARGDDHWCGLTTSGRIWCWGGFDFFGELGSPPVSRPGIEANIRPTPAPIDSLPR